MYSLHPLRKSYKHLGLAENTSKPCVRRKQGQPNRSPEPPNRPLSETHHKWIEFFFFLLYIFFIINATQKGHPMRPPWQGGRE